MPPRRTANGSRPRPKAVRPPVGTFAYLGETYKLDTKVGIWPLMQFARAAESGLDAVDQKGLAAIHAFLQDVIDPEDWGRFQEDMISKKVTDIAALMSAAQVAVNEIMERMSKANTKAEIVESATE